MQSTTPLLRAPLLVAALCGLALAGATACGDDDGRSASDASATPAAAPAPGASTRGGGLDGVRERADAAFAELGRGEPRSESRSESRIGPQPWPEDLPDAWPRPAEGRVLADTRRDGDRLLLVDWTGPPDRARARYADALRAGGFEVEVRQDGDRRVLRAKHPDARAVLTFFERTSRSGPVTRIEILFPRRASG